jgi:quinol monooxygenase YgiN
MMAEVIAINRYAVRDAAAFDSAVAALVDRVESEGHPGVQSYQFYRPTPDEGRAVVRYADPEAWVGHHDLIMGWPEMAAFRASADLAEVLLFGPVTAAMQDWLARMALGDRVRLMGPATSGFQR